MNDEEYTKCLQTLSNWPQECDGNGYVTTHFLIEQVFRTTKHKPVMLAGEYIIWKEANSYYMKRKLTENDVLKEVAL